METKDKAAPSAGQHLVWQARDGDTNAFRQLYEATVPRIYALCVRMCGDAPAAEDLCQDVYLKAWRALPRFNGDAAFHTWLHRIAVNASLDWIRKKSPERHDDLELIADYQQHKSWNISNRHERLDLEQALAALPAKARQVVVLFDIEGYSHDEIATMLGITTGTTKSQLHRARKLLQEMIR